MSGHCCRTPMNCNSFLTSIPASKLVSSQAVHFICTPLPHLSESLLLGLSWEFSGYGYFGASSGGASFKEPPCQCRRLKGHRLGREDPMEKGTATHSSILAWRIPGTEKPGRLLFIGYQRVGHDWNDFAKTWVQRNLKAFQVIPICSKALLKLPYAFETHESLSKDSWALCQDFESGLG